MKERPILFNGEMVRAVLDGRKTQTRRVIKTQPPNLGEGDRKHSIHHCGYGWFCCYQSNGGKFGIKQFRCPYGKPGDRLWVRETFALSGYQRYEYKACPADGKDFRCVDRWKPSIHMPRSASRILLEVVSVLPQRISEITEKDAWAEGFHAPDGDNKRYRDRASYWFRNLWDSINGNRVDPKTKERLPYAWADNPWVWVVEFKVVKIRKEAS